MQKIKCLVPHCDFYTRLRSSLLIVPPSQIVSGMCAVYGDNLSLGTLRKMNEW